MKLIFITNFLKCQIVLMMLIFFIVIIVFVLQIDEHVQREIMNHRSLKHPNIVRFKEVSELVVLMSKGSPALP